MTTQRPRTMSDEARSRAPECAGESETLRGMLAHHRDTLRWKCADLDEDQLHHRPLASAMTLGGLVLHLTMVEAGWFNRTFAGGVTKPGWLDVAHTDDHEWAWAHARDFPQEQLWRWFDEAVDVSDDVVERALATPQGLDARAVDHDEPMSMRWILLHMIEEYARHNGHADLLREAIDGRVGE